MDDRVSQPSPTRRKVIQGSLAAPVVLTVSSASAQSVSSFGRCLANLNNQPVGPVFTKDSTADNWLRSMVTVNEMKSGDTRDWFYLDPVKQAYVSVTNLTTTVYQLDVGKNWKLTNAKPSSRWILVWVDSTSGTPYKLTVQKPTLGYQATTKSCYTSLMQG